MGLGLTGDPINRINVVEPHGDLDLASAPALKRRLRTAMEHERKLVLVDLTDVTYIDSSGVAALVFAYLRLRSSGGRFAVVAPSAHQQRLFAIAGLDTILGVQATKAEAVARVTALA
jgi:anti-sigma B factor antagonist